MLALHILRWLLLGAQVLLALPILYLCILSIAAILTAKKRKKRAMASSPDMSPCVNFAILIPAHNEECMLDNLLQSLREIAYPKARYGVYVVADNCTDSTSEIARATGWVRVYDRFDETKRGKGYALNWLLQQLEEDQLIHDAYVVLDADSVVVPTFLQSMAQELAQGAQAMQASNTVLNVSESPSTALRLIALTLMNHVRPLGRNALGASSTLTGNGMCFKRDLLQRQPWQAFGVAEDYQYYLTLVQQGERVKYVPEAIVLSHMPTTFAQMRTQDIRWESSAPKQSTWRIALGLLRAGLRLRDWVRIDAAAELLVPPLSFLVGLCLLTLTASLLLWSFAALLLNALLIAGLIFYIGTALYSLRPSKWLYKALLYAPGFIVWKLWVYFVVRRRKKQNTEWVRTTRTISVK